MAAHWQHVAEAEAAIAVTAAAAAHLCCALFFDLSRCKLYSGSNNIFVVVPVAVAVAVVVFALMQIVAVAICLAVNNTNNCWQHCM